MGKEFHYSVNMLSLEDQAVWDSQHALKEIRENRLSLREKAFEQIPVDELPAWLVVDQLGIRGNSLHDVYIAFKITSLLTPKGRRRTIERVLRMVGVPLVKVNRTGFSRWEIDPNGIKVVLIINLNK